MTVEKHITCTFTGHRENKLPWRGNENDPRCLRMKEQIAAAVDAAYAAGKRHFICGMATGGDMYFGEAVIALREEHPEVTLEAAIPCEGQSKQWSLQLRKRYDRLAVACDYHTVVQREYTPECMMRRNRYMVDASSMLIAVYNGRPGGTQATLLYAIRQGLEIIELPVEE